MKRRLWILAATALLGAHAAHAANCTWPAVPTNINFGTYSVFGGAVTGNSTFTIDCTPPSTGVVTLTRGGSATYARQLSRTTAPAATLGYNLFREAGLANIWGDGTSGTQYLSFVPTAGNKALTATIFGQIPASLDSPPGTYTDTIQATLSWGGGTDSRFFTVTTTIVAECSVVTTPLNFGNYDPVSANAATPADATTVIQVYCTSGTPVTVGLDNGLYAVGAARNMNGPASDRLGYQLYKDAGRATIWNTTNLNSGTSTSKLIPINSGFTAYGRVAAGQDVRAGSYTDTIQVTVNY